MKRKLDNLLKEANKNLAKIIETDSLFNIQNYFTSHIILNYVNQYTHSELL